MRRCLTIVHRLAGGGRVAGAQSARVAAMRDGHVSHTAAPAAATTAAAAADAAAAT